MHERNLQLRQGLGPIRRVAMVAGAAAFCLSLSACVAPAILAPAAVDVAAMSTSVFTRGTMSAAYATSFDNVAAAAANVLLELGFLIRIEGWTDDHVYLSATDDRGTSYTVRIRRLTDRVTELSVRVGLFGDQPLSALIVDHVESRLRGEAPLSIPKKRNPL